MTNRLLSSIVHFIICIFIYSYSLAVDLRLELKEFDNQIAFIFFHDRSVQLTSSINENFVLIKADDTIKLNIVNNALLSKFASTPKLNNENNSLEFSIKGNYKFIGHINGEKLTAVKFKKIEDEKDTKSSENNITQEETSTSSESSNEKESNSNKITLTVNKNQNTITFPLENTSNAAVFQQENDLFVVFDGYKKFTIVKNKLIDGFSQLNDKKNTILKIKLPSKRYVQSITNQKKSLQIILDKIPVSLKHKININATEKNKNIILNLSKIKINNLITINQENSNEKFIVVPVSIPGLGVDVEKRFNDFIMIPTSQGLVLKILNDKIKVTNTSKTINVAVPIVSLEKKVNVNSLTLEDNNQTLLPISEQNLNNATFFNVEKIQFIQKICASVTDEEYYINFINLAKFYFRNGLYYESLGMLQSIKRKQEAFFLKDSSSVFLMAVNLTLLFRTNEAQEAYITVLNSYKDKIPSEINLWYQYNQYLLGNISNNITFLVNVKSFISDYPDDIYWKLALAELDADVQLNNLKAFELLLHNLRTPKKINDQNSLDFFIARYYQKNKQIDETLLIYNKLSNQIEDPYNMVRSKLSLIRILYNDKKIELSKAISDLEKARYNWRGDQLEVDLLLTLASCYKSNKSLVETLRILNIIKQAFPGNSNNFYITAEMAEIYNHIFLLGGEADKMDPFEVVSFFYEFQNLIPSGVAGDKVVLGISKKLIILNLLDTAIDLLQHQIKYRLTGQNKAITANHLAIVYLLNNEPQKAFDILQKTDNDNSSFSEYQYRLHLKAKALMDMKKNEQALKYLESDNSEDAILLKKEIYFSSSKWQNYIDIAESQIIKEIYNKTTVTNSQSVGQDIIRLAVSYNMLNNDIKLKMLEQLINENKQYIPNFHSIVSIMDFLINTKKIPSFADLNKVIDVNQIEQLMNKLKQDLF